MGLVSDFGCDLNPGEDGRVRSAGVIVEEEIADDENDGNCNHRRPYLCDGPRPDSEMPQFFRDESGFANSESCSTSLDLPMRPRNWNRSDYRLDDGG